MARCDSREFSEWQAFYGIEPWGEERADLRMGIMASVIANAHRDPKKSRPFKPRDFMPNFDPPKQQDVRTMEARLRAYAIAKGAKIITPGKAA